MAYSDGYAARNVIDQPLRLCGNTPKTGFYRDGFCKTGASDRGIHVVCASVTREFLSFSKQRGNDLVSPNPAFRFPGLKPGDRWCLCAARYREALAANKAPPVDLAATHYIALRYIPLDALQTHALP